MKAFVTGATGFIGRHLVDRLIREGWDVVALVRNSNHGLPPAVDVVFGDILEPSSFSGAVNGCDRIYHLAAQITFNPREKEQLLRTNKVGTENVLGAVGRHPNQRTVVVSSACTIGLSHHRDLVLDETEPPNPLLVARNPYLASKLAAEKVAMKFAREQTVVIVNPTTVYGPGDWSLNSGTLIRGIAKMPMVPVPSGGSNIVDVEDVVVGIIKAGTYGRSGCRYILGGWNLRFSDIFVAVAETIGRRPVFVDVPSWMRIPLSKTVKSLSILTGSRFITEQIIDDLFAFKYFSNRRAIDELRWHPRFSFRQSVKRAWAFYRKEGLIV